MASPNQSEQRWKIAEAFTTPDAHETPNGMAGWEGRSAPRNWVLHQKICNLAQEVAQVCQLGLKNTHKKFGNPPISMSKSYGMA